MRMSVKEKQIPDGNNSFTVKDDEGSILFAIQWPDDRENSVVTIGSGLDNPVNLSREDAFALSDFLERAAMEAEKVDE
jgi:hypothetical protein